MDRYGLVTGGEGGKRRVDKLDQVHSLSHFNALIQSVLLFGILTLFLFKLSVRASGFLTQKLHLYYACVL